MIRIDTNFKGYLDEIGKNVVGSFSSTRINKKGKGSFVFCWLLIVS